MFFANKRSATSPAISNPAGWSWGYCCAVTRDGWRWIVDAHCEGGRYIVHADELLSAFLELEQTLLGSGALLRNQ